MEIGANFTEKAKRDYELVERARNDSDQKAFTELMKNYKDAIYFLMLKMTNDPHDAEDLTIEAFGKAFKNIHQYTPDFAFSTWLFKIASNNCIDFIRKKRLHVTSLNDTIDEENDSELSQNIPCERPDPEEIIMKKQKNHLMHEVVDKLKPHYKKLVELRYFKEYSYEEIATELNLPLGTVKAQLFRARDLLYHILKEKQGTI
ncbi:MAG: RNA polymerase subunit sigma-24 [Marinilabiliales bacterium]|nr:MAG: RNA polymerase subunit sigma-24 [Marinilabiliales bacterium]